MDANFDKPGLLEKISLVIAASFIPLSLVCAIIWPVSGLPLWGKGLFTGVFFLLVYYSFRKRRRDDAMRQQTQQAGAEADQAAAGHLHHDTPHNMGREERLSGRDHP